MFQFFKGFKGSGDFFKGSSEFESLGNTTLQQSDFYNCRAFKSPNGAQTILITVWLLMRNFYYKSRIRYGCLTTVVFSLFLWKWPSLYLRNSIRFDMKSFLLSTLIIDKKFWKILFLCSSQGLLRHLPEKPLCFNPIFWLWDAVWYECSEIWDQFRSLIRSLRVQHS